MPSGKLHNQLAASSAVRVINCIINDTNEIIHAPAPNGLLGGYPVKVNRQGVEVILPEGVTIEEAMEINRIGMQCDGIQEVAEDGSITFTPQVTQTMKELFDYDLKPLAPSDWERRAKELKEL